MSVSGFTTKIYERGSQSVTPRVKRRESVRDLKSTMSKLKGFNQHEYIQEKKARKRPISQQCETEEVGHSVRGCCFLHRASSSEVGSRAEGFCLGSFGWRLTDRWQSRVRHLWFMVVLLGLSRRTWAVTPQSTHVSNRRPSTMVF